jgi:antitoxin (DNA-binding transcriptional repressor) of toxin-antitoxin stability system
MRFISVRDLRGKSAEIWRELADEREMVVTSNGRPIAILAAVNEASLEASLRAFRRARAVDAVIELQRTSMERGSDALGPAEVDAEIAIVRRKRRR